MPCPNTVHVVSRLLMPCPNSVCVVQNVSLLRAELLPSSYVQALLALDSPAERWRGLQSVRGLPNNHLPHPPPHLLIKLTCTCFHIGSIKHKLVYVCSVEIVSSA